MQNDINDVNESVLEANQNIVDFKNSIQEIQWDVFDKLQERISGIADESDFLTDLMSSEKLFDDTGNITEFGKATMGIHGVNYNTYMSQADEYRKEMEKIQKELESDPYNETLIERRKELLELQQESILAAEDEKDAIRDLVEEGIELQLDSLKELIEKYENALDSQKDLYDYQNQIAEKQQEIASLEKQMIAYAGDDSEEGNAKYKVMSKKGLSNGTIRNLHNSVLFPTFQRTVDDDSLRKNPCVNCLQDYGYDPKGKRDALSEEEQKIFVKFVEKDPVYSKYIDIVKLILVTGLRRGEVLGLTWTDIDFKKKIIYVNKQLQYEKVNGVFKFSIIPPKTDAGNRQIPISDETVKWLKELKTKTHFENIRHNVTVDGISGFLFLNRNKDNPIIPRQLADSFGAASDKYNKKEIRLAELDGREAVLLPKVTPHVLRHTACTRWVEQKIDFKVLQCIMGHASAIITMNIYSHVFLHKMKAKLYQDIPKYDVKYIISV